MQGYCRVQEGCTQGCPWQGAGGMHMGTLHGAGEMHHAQVPHHAAVPMAMQHPSRTKLRHTPSTWHSGQGAQRWDGAAALRRSP